MEQLRSKERGYWSHRIWPRACIMPPGAGKAARCSRGLVTTQVVVVALVLRKVATVAALVVVVAVIVVLSKTGPT